MKIGVDISGGDFAPTQTMIGAIDAMQHLNSGETLVLIGKEKEIKEQLEKASISEGAYEIVNAPDVIGMNEHPAKAFAQKPNSSISVGFHLLKSGKIDAFASAGNTGAMMAGSMLAIKTIPGIIRPVIASIVPKENGSIGLLLDVGINSDCKPESLYQFAVLGTLLAKSIYKMQHPTVGLMSIGEEDEKGNAVTQAANQLLRSAADINFIGNVEGRDLFNDKADIIVCDGFTGNILLKAAESFYTLIKKRGIDDDYFERFNYEQYGGIPVLGINSTVVIAHGISNAKAIKNMILMARNTAKANLVKEITETLSQTINN
ncbi:MAG TPA: phosphate acyltransferase PlsX [Bacteroidia bacterium]|nr:phosphate acyltransferase PlsX [Bacteroidia bacterium]HNT79544.1 phosphate acyltransferase PlsX [Bacteroidia bacterium]